MSQWAELKKEFYRVAITQGLVEVEQVAKAFPLGISHVPAGRVEKWLRLLRKNPEEFSQKRWVNRFKVGADPEFVFAQHRSDYPGRYTRADARALGLKQGPAFGADNNGRLAEIRPHPSRSVVEVCASVLATLRWMAIIYPETMCYSWLSGAFILGDGIGGHVHFGRKRPNRRLEVEALDNITSVLTNLGMYPLEESLRRRAGDERGQHYGVAGDYRLQTHGYEYRAFPSWLDSPEMAFLTMTLSKLSVHAPDIRPEMKYDGFNSLKNFLAYYKDVDDDARLACLLVEKVGIPKQLGGDFRGRWGIGPGNPLPKIGVRPQVVPLSIKPTEEDTQEMFEYLLTLKPLGFRIPKVNWSPSSVPEGYKTLISRTETMAQKGLGEMIWDLCSHQKKPLLVLAGKKGHAAVSIARRYAQIIPGAEEFMGKMCRWHDGEMVNVWVGQEVLESPIRSREIKRILTAGYLPLWKARDVKKGSFEEWEKRVVNPPPKKKDILDSEVIFSSGDLPPGII